MADPFLKSALFALTALLLSLPVRADEPPALNPFGSSTPIREDALPGYVELSDGTVHPGRLYLTRDTRLKILDDKLQRIREVPLPVVQRIDGVVQKEWVEKEWRFKENASDVKVYTGRTYPVREYSQTITLKDGRTISGSLSAILYVQAEGGDEPERYLLHLRDKGEAGTDLESLVYVRAIRLGDKALEEGRQKVKKAGAKPKGGTVRRRVISRGRSKRKYRVSACSRAR